MSKKYLDLLKDPRWQKKRLEILERDGWACKLCGDKESTLAVHHCGYHGKPWESPDEELETLCEKCHAVISEFESLAKKKFSIEKSAMLIVRTLLSDVDDVDLAAMNECASKWRIQVVNGGLQNG